jgi:hypothetical protein
MEPTELAKIYSGCMEEIKARTNIILAFNERRLTTGSEVTDVEFVCLQLRKVLELIALSSIAPNKEEYSKQRSKFNQDWHANRILKDLERVNFDFYPVPIVQAPNPTNRLVKHFEPIKNDYLTREQFEGLYDSLGGVLHASNPFGEKRDWGNVRKDFGQWASKIINLLNIHRVRLIDTSQIWVVVMTDARDSKVHTYIAQDVDKFIIKTER